MRIPLSASIAGSSVLFDGYTYSKLTESNEYIRYGINNETGKNIEIEQTSKYPQLKDKKGIVVSPIRITSKTFNNLIGHFPGAFVKDPSPRIINDGSLVIDLDASSLYPSMILQYNISFDSYKARILPICTYKTLELLEKCLGIQPYPNGLNINIEKLVWDYVDNKDVPRKKQTAMTLYYTILYLFDSLMKTGLPLQQILMPTTTSSSLILKTILIPLMDLINRVHPENYGYSKFAYDYLFSTANEQPLDQKYPFIYVVHDAGKSKIHVTKYLIQQGISYIQNYIITLAGTLFEKHENKMGLFTNFLQQMGNLRKHYKTARDNAVSLGRNSHEYILNDNRQASVKVIMNTTYGLYGLTNFRYSNHWLAQSITNSGELTIKLAQYIAEQHLEFKYGH